MIDYSLLIISTLFILFINRLISARERNLVVLIIVFMMCTIMPAIKNMYVGTDSSMYVDMFSDNLTYKEWFYKGIEIGFVTVIKALHELGAENYFYYFLVFSLIYNFCFIRTIFKISINIEVSMLVFFTFSTLYIFHFNVLRQSLAIAFFCLSLPYILNRSHFKSYICIGLAVCFHYSALILLVFPILYSWVEKRFKLTVVLSIIGLLIYTKLTSYLISFMVGFTGSTRYDYYNSVGQSSGGKLCILNVIILILITVFTFKSSLKNNPKYKFFFYLFILQVVTYVCVTYLGLRYEGPGRILNYFYVGTIFMFPYILGEISRKARPLAYIIFFLLMISYTLMLLVFTDFHGFIPYFTNPYYLQLNPF